MPKPLVAYLATLVSFLALEGGWLAVAGPSLYKPEIGILLAEKPRLPPGAVFYLLYVGGAVWLVVLPAMESGWVRGFVNGAILGLIAYATYDLTCAATMKVWSNKVTVADMAWGALATGMACTMGVFATKRLSA